MEKDQETAKEKLINCLNQVILPFAIEDSSTHEVLLNAIGNARLVLIGEATHGTEEFYQARIALSKALIEKKGFHAIAIEADWPSVYGIHRYVQGYGEINDSIHCLKEFTRFPTWMWGNTTIPPFLKWLRQYNQVLSPKNWIGFYGLDLYSLKESIHAVIEYLKMYDPDAAKMAEERYACFEQVSNDPQAYAYFIKSGVKKNCIKEVSEQFLEMQHRAFNQLSKTQHIAEAELLFFAMQNARLIKNSEHYYRALFESREKTWNIRDHHMAETLQNLISYLETKLNVPPKIVVWAHNSHVGDARATEMNRYGERNLGQLIREQFNNVSFHIGFSTYQGSVTAAYHWNEPHVTQSIKVALEGSYEDLFHQLRLKNFLLLLHGKEEMITELSIARLQRAIGVVYRPDAERLSHYFFARLPYQFDAMIHMDNTHALQALDKHL